MLKASSRFLTPAASIAVFALLGACAQQPAEYSWSNPESGEYLFAFDTRDCGDIAERAAADDESVEPALGSPAFFECMEERGYYLVDPATGEPLAADTRDVLSAAYAPQASR